MISCKDCGKEISEDCFSECIMCGEPLCEECAIDGFCFTCFDLWESEIDLDDNYYEDLEGW